MYHSWRVPLCSPGNAEGTPPPPSNPSPGGTTQMQGHTIKRVLGGALAALAGVVALGGTAFASPTPPVASSALPGTWANTNSATRSVRNVVIQSDDRGGILVDAFGACEPTSCEWGRAPAIL